MVVLTLPFTKLKQVNLSNLSLPSWKTNAIQNLGYGTNSKLLLGFNQRVWRNYQQSGYVFTNGTPANPSVYLQSGWDNSSLQPGTIGGYTVYQGGIQGEALSLSRKNIFLNQLETMWPGSSSAHNGMAKLIHWPSYTFSLGSYACWRVGQVTSIMGAEKLPVGNLFFAGEHTSTLNQGYMEGGAETGADVARSIARLLQNGNRQVA
jgi:monoamine oxidase